MRVVITGGAGFIGSALVRHVLVDDAVARVTTLDALTYAGNPANLLGLDENRHTLVRGDVCDPDAVARVVDGADVVLHLAAETHVDRSLDDASAHIRTNVAGTRVVLEACRRAEVGRVVHVSTDEVYGSIAVGAVAEDAPMRPASPYAASKVDGDALALAEAAEHGTPVVVARPSNTFGPRQYPEKVVPLFVTNLLEGLSVPVYGDGRQVRDWLAVEDHASALWHLATHGEVAVGAAYNVAGGNERANLDLTRALLALLGADDSRIEHVEDRPNHDRRYAVDDAKIRATGWAPTLTFDDALAATVDWYRANDAWWRPLRDAGASRRRGLDAT